MLEDCDDEAAIPLTQGRRILRPFLWAQSIRDSSFSGTFPRRGRRCDDRRGHRGGRGGGRRDRREDDGDVASGGVGGAGGSRACQVVLFEARGAVVARGAVHNMGSGVRAGGDGTAVGGDWKDVGGAVVATHGQPAVIGREAGVYCL